MDENSNPHLVDLVQTRQKKCLMKIKTFRKCLFFFFILAIELKKNKQTKTGKGTIMSLILKM